MMRQNKFLLTWTDEKGILNHCKFATKAVADHWFVNLTMRGYVVEMVRL